MSTAKSVSKNKNSNILDSEEIAKLEEYRKLCQPAESRFIKLKDKDSINAVLSGMQTVSIFKTLMAIITFLTINGCPRSLSEDAGHYSSPSRSDWRWCCISLNINFKLPALYLDISLVFLIQTLSSVNFFSIDRI